MASHVFPLFLSRFSSKDLPEKFGIGSVKIELFGDDSKNTLTFNNDAKILGNSVLAKPKAESFRGKPTRFYYALTKRGKKIIHTKQRQS